MTPSFTLTPSDKLAAALEGATEVQKPMIGSTLTRVAVFLPLAFLSEITGALFAPISIIMTLLLVKVTTPLVVSTSEDPPESPKS